MSLLALLHRKVANSMIIVVCRCTALELSMIHDHTSLTLCWCSVLGGDSDKAVGSFAYKGGQYGQYGIMLSHSLVIIQDATPDISDASLTLISRIV
jgi:hypothetical protein